MITRTYSNFDSLYFQQLIDSLAGLYILFDLQGVILACNQLMSQLMINDLKGEIIGMTYMELTSLDNHGKIFLENRVSKFEECINNKCKTHFIDINRNNIYKGILTPIIDNKNNIKFIGAHLDDITSKKLLEFQNILFLFSPKEVSFLQEIVKHLSICMIYENDAAFIKLYNFNLSQVSKIKIDRVLMNNSGYFNRSEYANRINNKITKNNIVLRDFLLCMKLFFQPDA